MLFKKWKRALLVLIASVLLIVFVAFSIGGISKSISPYDLVPNMIKQVESIEQQRHVFHKEFVAKSLHSNNVKNMDSYEGRSKYNGN